VRISSLEVVCGVFGLDLDRDKKALERVSGEVEVLRGSMERLGKEKTDAKHSAG
jgi:hypothetical protein